MCYLFSYRHTQIKMRSAGDFRPGLQLPACKLLAQPCKSTQQLLYKLNLRGLQNPLFILLRLPPADTQGEYSIARICDKYLNLKQHKMYTYLTLPGFSK